MKTKLLAVAALAVATSTFAQEAENKPAELKPVDAQTEKLVRAVVPACPDMKIARGDFAGKLPARMTGSVIRISAARQACEGQFLMVVAPSGDFYLGLPWMMGEEATGNTLADKLKNFGWDKLQENFTPEITPERTRNGLYPVTMWEMTERGKIPIEGEIDQDGKVFFLGHFHPANTDLVAARLKAFEPILATEPSHGAAKPDVTVVEFSDFECPSCRRASGYVDSILAKYGDRVRYVRYDLPLVTTHPWAFGAAMAGRAIWRQKPDAFWEFKKQIYANQDNLTAFTLDDFARGFAQDHELDLHQYDADIVSENVRDQILKGVGAAFSNDVRATPTYMVNGVYVDPGDDGKALENYVASLLTKK